jgi:penicillin-binding protein 2
LRRQRQDLVDFFEQYSTDTRFYVGEVDLDVYTSRAGDLLSICAIAEQNTIERQTRHYYRGNAVSHVTGHIGQIPADSLQTWLDRGYESGDLIGISGIEAAYETQLSGQPERLLRITEPGGIAVRELGSTEGTPPQPITLTIDRELQAEVAQALADAYNYAEPNWGARGISTGAAAVVMDVNTGAILAMSSYPLYEPDVFNPDTACCTLIPATDRITELFTDTRTPLFNRVVQGQFSPGSVFKIVTTAAAAQEDIRDPNEIFYCGLDWPEGPDFGDTVGFIRQDWRASEPEEFRFPTGDINMSGALTSSCDPFFYQMGAQLFSERGPTTLMDYARRMGLGAPTGINYYGTDAVGQLPTPNSVSAAINTAIGQGDVQVSPLQMVRLTAAIANGGTVYQPYLVEQVGGLDGTDVSFQAQPTVIGEIGIDEASLEIVRKGMCDVTTNETLGTAVWPFEGVTYHACGKTGTAQTSRYPNAWFVSYVPADNPQIAITVMAEQSLEGSQVAAPITRRIIDFYLNQPWPGYPPFWSEGPYTPLNIPQGGTGGG